VYQSQQRTHLVITALFFSCVLGVGLFAVFTAVGNHLTKDWSDQVQRGPRRSAPHAPVVADSLAPDDS
jgi:hypothetical protein